MFDDLRGAEQNPEEETSPFPQAEEIYQSAVQEEEEGNHFLGMTAPQRFVIVMLLFFLTCVLGGFGLILTGKVVLPIF